jgi:SPP1 family predicted phage head-tail adaptor
MNAGRLDRRVRIEYAPAATDTKTGFNQPIKSFALLREVWGSKKDLSGDEAIRAQQLAAKVSTEFTIRYPGALEPLPSPSDRMRLVCEGVVYDITHVSEIGRREGLRILAWARAEVAA